MYVCTYIHTCIHTYIHTYVSTYARISQFKALCKPHVFALYVTLARCHKSGLLGGCHDTSDDCCCRSRCLSSLLPVRGLDLSRLVVFLDGDFPEVMELLALLGVTVHQHYLDLAGLSSDHVATRIGYNYRYGAIYTRKRHWSTLGRNTTLVAYQPSEWGL